MIEEVGGVWYEEEEEVGNLDMLAAEAERRPYRSSVRGFATGVPMGVPVEQRNKPFDVFVTLKHFNLHDFHWYL